MKKVLLVGIGEVVTPEMHEEYDMILIGDGKAQPDCTHRVDIPGMDDIQHPIMLNQYEIGSSIRGLLRLNAEGLEESA